MQIPSSEIEAEMVKRCSIFDMGRLKDVYREFGWPSENYRKEERMEKLKEVWEIFCENAATVATWSSEEATLHLSTLTSRVVALGRIVGILSISSMVSWLSLYNALLLPVTSHIAALQQASHGSRALLAAPLDQVLWGDSFSSLYWP